MWKVYRQTTTDAKWWQYKNIYINGLVWCNWIETPKQWPHQTISLGFPRERWTLLWDLTISGWPNEWINITWQCFIKSDSRYLYEYIISYNYLIDKLDLIMKRKYFVLIKWLKQSFFESAKISVIDIIHVPHYEVGHLFSYKMA